MQNLIRRWRATWNPNRGTYRGSKWHANGALDVAWLFCFNIEIDTGIFNKPLTQLLQGKVSFDVKK